MEILYYIELKETNMSKNVSSCAVKNLPARTPPHERRQTMKNSKNLETKTRLCEAYKKTRLLETADLSRFEGRLSPAEIEELKKQISYLVLEAEEEAFMAALEFSENTVIPFVRSNVS